MQSRDKELKCGILLPLSSLPSNYGIGSFGNEALAFIDFLKDCNQNYWQLLPLCPVGKGNSPYSSTASFAGEILYLDLEMLAKDGLLSKSDIKSVDFGANVNYELVKKYKLPLIKKAVSNFNKSSREFINFKKTNHFWLYDFAIFESISDSLSQNDFIRWPDEYKYRLVTPIKEFCEENEELISFYEITQFLFFLQFSRIKQYANQSGIKLIGDIPFYVAANSCDVWQNPNCFLLNRDMTPSEIAGVPPDVFSETGQLWSNPIYDWAYHKETQFLWWKKRLSHMAKMYDAIRIDHFRAFADYYSVKCGSKSAENGVWKDGVGIEFFEDVKPLIAGTEIIAEDLGGETDKVQNLVKQTGFANMKVLQFAFNSDLKNKFLPDNYDKNCFCYTGTHDNDTTVGWYKKLGNRERMLFSLIVPKQENFSPTENLIAYGMKSKAKTVIIPMQDYLELDSASRTNTPGSENGNWEWRLEKSYCTKELKAKIKMLCDLRGI